MRGEVDNVLLGRLQNSAKDRNWDRIEALWKMKEEVKGDKTLTEAFKAEGGHAVMAALEKTERGKKFIAERIRPYQREFGWAAVWVHEFTFPTQFEDPAPFLETVKGYIETDYDYPSHVKEPGRRHQEGLRGTGRRARLVRPWPRSRRPTPST